MPRSPQPNFPDEAFYIYNNGSETDLLQGRQFFGSQDKTGVDQAVWNANQNDVVELLFIGQCNSDREQFLTANGILLQNPNRTWQVKIDSFGTVNGETRVEVISDVGSDLEQNGGIRLGVEKTVNEIWKLDPIGSTPTLLDRSTIHFRGLYTHAESPVIPTPPWPNPTDRFGPPEDPNEMGTP